MNSQNNPHEPVWLDESLDAYFASASGAIATIEQPSEAFAERCQAAAALAIEIARLGRERSKLTGALGSLREHFYTLAQLAGVKIEEVFRFLNIARADEPDAASAWGLARLAQLVGMGLPEAELRLRLGFALGHRTVVSTALAAELVPAYMQRAARPTASRVEPLLRACEASYSSARREKLRGASASLSAVFEDEEK